jgi:cytidylate kinase
MSTGSQTLSNRRKMKELEVLKLHSQGYSYRHIAKNIHMSLRDVAKYVQTISNKRESQSRTSINDEIVLEYRVNLLRSEVRDLELKRQSLRDELDEFRAKKIKVRNQLHHKQSELDAVKRDMASEKFSKEVLKDISPEGQ